MKYIYLILLLFCTTIYGQTSNTNDSGDYISSQIVDVVPLLSECDKLTTKETKRTCMNTQLEKHVQQHFNYSIIKTLQQEIIIQKKKNKHNKNYKPLLLPGTYNTIIEFTINRKGNPSNIIVRAIHPKLRKEGLRVVKLLPQMKPGREARKIVNVKYILPPISFTIK
ncbi:TonB C-terminal domain-containing protein precursor [Tenacibaculum sp. 190130A14a]|uniref:TonB family protein n=1 Tax=Tenacibaculum polynesiense TaxID=3137857 RepID=A0ABM9P9X8_9FLAO